MRGKTSMLTGGVIERKETHLLALVIHCQSKLPAELRDKLKIKRTSAQKRPLIEIQQTSDKCWTQG